MTELFKYSEAPDRGMAIEDPVASALSHLQGQTNYALVGRSAVAAYAPLEQRMKAPVEVVGDITHPSVVRAQQSILFDDAIIREAQTAGIAYGNEKYAVRVAKPEFLVAIALAENLRFGRDAAILFKTFGLELGFEEVRNLLENH